MTCIWDFYYKLEDKTKNLTEETDITDMTAQRLVDCTETMEPSRAWMESLSPDAHGYLSPWTHHKSALRQRFSRAKGEREIARYIELLLFFILFLFIYLFWSFECVDHWRCQTCVQCTKFPPLWRWSRWRQSCGVTSLHSRQRLKRIEEQDLLMPTGLSVMYYLSSDCQKGRPESYPQLKIWPVVI